ncbi:MAG: hypothetical protein K2O14_00140, partial [Oscillospiraceae bacterium]|nr:hypothetical protein [Oscillospiraceae bacterium]
MNFKEEYIKAAEEFTPDRQTIDRMKENVLNMTRTKRALPFKTVAIVGGTVAACAVITIAAARIAPNIANDSNLIGESVNMATGSAADGMNGAADDVGADSAPEAAVDVDGCDFYNGTMEIWDDSVYGEAVAPDVNYTDIKDVPAQEEAAADKSVDEPNDIATMAPAATYYPETLETGFESFDSEGCSPSEMSSAGGTYDKIIDDEPNVIPEDDCEDTLENEGFAATGVP